MEVRVSTTVVYSSGRLLEAHLRPRHCTRRGQPTVRYNGSHLIVSHGDVCGPAQGPKLTRLCRLLGGYLPVCDLIWRERWKPKEKISWTPPPSPSSPGERPPESLRSCDSSQAGRSHPGSVAGEVGRNQASGQPAPHPASRLPDDPRRVGSNSATLNGAVSTLLYSLL